MKLTFRGWKREVYPHHHQVLPVILDEEDDRLYERMGDGSLSWHSPARAYGKVNELELKGSFLVELDFVPEELRNWLRVFVKKRPEDAIRLLAEMQGEAIPALAAKTADSLFDTELSD